jgi:fatty-acyl-CoA synthase
MNARRDAAEPVIASLSDIAAIEQQPYREIVPHTTINQLIDELARHGDRTAISFMPNGDPAQLTEDTTFVDLHRMVMRASNAFDRLGVASDEAVAYLLPSVPQALVTLFAAELIGRACPINFMLSASAIASIMIAANATVLVAFGPDADLDIWPKVEEIRKLIPALKRVVVVGTDPSVAGCTPFDELIAGMPAEPCFARNNGPDTVAAIYHTGGSTGSPKLVRHTHANQIHCLSFVRRFFELGPQDVVINGHPLFHVAGALTCGLGPLVAGSRLLMPSKLGLRNRKFQANIWRAVERHRVTMMIGGPTVIMMLLGQDPGPNEISSMRLHMSGGSLLPPELVSRMWTKFGIPVKNSWGMTETGGLLTLEPIRAPSVPGSCGWRMPYTEIAALELAAGGRVQQRRCKAGDVGALAVKGPHVTPGYVDDAHNAASFTADGWFLTGDLGWIDAEGRVYLTGRAKDIIIRGGHNIDPLMIEQALLQHPEVQLCAAVGQPDPYAGEVPVAFVKLAPGSSIAPDDLIDAVRPSIAEPAAVPKHLYPIDSFPMTSTGKILKPALRRLATEAAVAEALKGVAPDGLKYRVSFRESGHRDVVRAEIPDGTPEDLVKKVRDAMALLRIPFELLVGAVTNRPS